MLDDRQIAILLKRFYDFELEAENRQRLSGVQFDENRKAAIAYFERLGVDVRQALARNELERAEDLVADSLEREGITRGSMRQFAPSYSRVFSAQAVT